jgi:hypothetical protein
MQKKAYFEQVQVDCQHWKNTPLCGMIYLAMYEDGFLAVFSPPPHSKNNQILQFGRSFTYGKNY